jgi:hypothetical protein
MTQKEEENFYPPFLSNKFDEAEKRLKQERETQNYIPYNPTKVTDFLPLLHCIWKISSKEYQKKFWGKQGQWGDNYMETMENFLGDAEGVLEANNPPDDPPIEMTKKQRELLKRFYDRADFFTRDPETPGSDYGENDEAIINDSKWQKIGEYAKLVYEELSGDDLNAWERSKNKNSKTQS